MQLRWMPILLVAALCGTVGRLVVGQRCPATPGDTMGPYYRQSGVPVFPNPMSQSYCLPAQGTKGSEVAITGVLLDEGCRRINGTATQARIELWQANNRGEYSDYSDPAAPAWCRARLRVPSSATYSFRTTFPGKYGSPGCLRPAHVHMRVTAAGYKPLVTQLYFRGDTNLGVNDCGCGSGCASGNPALQVALRGGAANFNIVLARA